MDVFVGVYTNYVKSYCDVRFFSALSKLTKDNRRITFVDNSEDLDYAAILTKLCTKYLKGWQWNVDHVEIAQDPKRSFMHRAIVTSVNKLREEFLKTPCTDFLIIESDVMVPSNMFELFKEVHGAYPIIGGIYYPGYHHEAWFKKDHAQLIPMENPLRTILSGCTMYSREVIEKLPFRYEENNLIPHADAFMSCDASSLGYKQADYTKIKCDHIRGRGYRTESI